MSYLWNSLYGSLIGFRCLFYPAGEFVSYFLPFLLKGDKSNETTILLLCSF